MEVNHSFRGRGCHWLEVADRRASEIVLSGVATGNKTARAFSSTGRRWYCLGLTKRWSLYVASSATPGPSATDAGRMQS